MSVSNRQGQKITLQNKHFDAVVVGGGISGAWIACQLSQKGYSVALLERHDFASETSSASSKLLHGGIRYLQQLQFGKVRESTIERAHYLACAPHLAQAVSFVVPTYTDLKRSKTVLQCGMLAYRTLGLGQQALLDKGGISLPPTRMMNQQQLLQLCKISTDRLTGAVSFPEFHLYDSERTVWSIIDTAIAHGASVINYANVQSLNIVHGRVTGVTARLQEDESSFVVSASITINAAGPWVDQVIRSGSVRSSDSSGSSGSSGLNSSNGSTASNSAMGSHATALQQSTRPQIIQGYASGAHLVTRQLVADHAIAVTTPQQSNARIDRGGRHIFIIPWRGLSLIGTSYRETSDPDRSEILQQEDMDQLLDAVNDALPAANLVPEDVLAAYSGLYPLRVNRIKQRLYQGSGEYLLLDHAADDQLEGLVTALGAKFTTGRKLAEITTRLCVSKLNAADIKPANAKRSIATSMKSTTSTASEMNLQRLHCASYDNLDTFMAERQEQLRGRFSPAQITHLVRCFGSTLDELVEFLDREALGLQQHGKEHAKERDGTADADLDLEQRIIDSQPDILGQAAWAVEREHAVHLDDVLLRRTSIGLLGIDDSGLNKVASVMARRLGWSDEQKSEELAQARQRHATVTQTVNHHFAARPAPMDTPTAAETASPAPC